MVEARRRSVGGAGAVSCWDCVWLGACTLGCESVEERSPGAEINVVTWNLQLRKLNLNDGRFERSRWLEIRTRGKSLVGRFSSVMLRLLGQVRSQLLGNKVPRQIYMDSVLQNRHCNIDCVFCTSRHRDGGDAAMRRSASGPGIQTRGTNGQWSRDGAIASKVFQGADAATTLDVRRSDAHRALKSHPLLGHLRIVYRYMMGSCIYLI